MQGLKLYTYWRSGAAHRVRIALALKGIGYESVPVHLLRDGGEQLKPAFRSVNPQARVPVLELAGGERLIQSPAILEFLEEAVPEPPLLPKDQVLRAKVRGVGALICCDTHPLNNVSVLGALRGLGADGPAVEAWIGRWIRDGLAAVEALIGGEGWCFGNRPGLADVCLIPQLFSARRFGISLDGFPRICRVCALADAHPCFEAAAPANQPDAA